MSDARDADATNHRATTLPPPLSRHLRSFAIKIATSPPRGVRQLDGKGAGRSVALGGVTETCCVALLPCSMTTTPSYDLEQ